MYAIQALLWATVGLVMGAVYAWAFAPRRPLGQLLALVGAAALAAGVITQLASGDPWSEAALVGAVVGAAIALVAERLGHGHGRPQSI
jgi:hypothetical protein